MSALSDQPSASIVIPTRDRPEYLDVALRTVMAQALETNAEVIVVDDGVDPATAAVVARHGARVIRPEGSGLNAARNAGVAAARGDPVVLIDDDVAAPPEWLSSLLVAIDRAPDHDVFGGPIRARLEGGGPRSCGREPAPITTLDLGPSDHNAVHVWGANMAIRKRAFARVGAFDETIAGRGDEEEWLRRYADVGGLVRYVAAAGVEHRRTRNDATVRSLSVAAYALGRTARRNDVRKGTPPSLAYELRILAGCVWHTMRRRCAFGIVFAAQAAGRLREALTSRS